METTRVKLNTFSSKNDFLSKLFGLFKGSSLLLAFLKTDRKFAEQLMLTVAMKNDCKA